MSSSALALVNKVLRGSGDYKQVTAISGNPAEIGERMLDFINEVIAEMEILANWAKLRVNFSGVTNGIDDVYDVSTADDVRYDSAISAWFTNGRLLEELTSLQFDKKLSAGDSGLSLYFQRGVSAAGLLEVQIFPVPASGMTLNVTAYRKAKRLILDTDTTDFDDDVLVVGALMRIDAYDGLERGYASLYKNMRDGLVHEQKRNQIVRVQPESYR